FPAAVGEEGGVYFFLVETGHGATIEAQGAGGDDEVCALERAVSHRVGFGEFFFAGGCEDIFELRGDGAELGDEFVESAVTGDDGGDGGGYGFIDVALVKAGFELFLFDLRFHEDHAHGHGVCGGWAKPGKIVDRFEEFIGNGLRQPTDVRAGFTENDIECVVG